MVKYIPLGETGSPRSVVQKKLQALPDSLTKLVCSIECERALNADVKFASFNVLKNPIVNEIPFKVCCQVNTTNAL